MKKTLATIFLAMSAALILLSLAGCEAPEGGSSIPWNRPQQWERQGIGGIGY